MQRYEKKLILILFLIPFFSCTTSWKVVNIESKLLLVEESKLHAGGEKMRMFIDPYKQELDSQLSFRIGEFKEDMKLSAPESLLSNYCADALLIYTQEHYPFEVDFSILNFGGLRKPLLKGIVTIRDIYELMPFDNEAVVIELSGKDVYSLLHKIANKGGEPISGVRMTIPIEDLSDIQINGKIIDLTKNYNIVTSDYLSDGNDEFYVMTNRTRISYLKIKMRDILINYSIDKTNKGETIGSSLDGRIYVKK